MTLVLGRAFVVVADANGGIAAHRHHYASAQTKQVLYGFLTFANKCATTTDGAAGVQAFLLELMQPLCGHTGFDLTAGNCGFGDQSRTQAGSQTRSGCAVNCQGR